MSAAEAMTSAERVVVKVGSSLLYGEEGAPNAAWLAGLCADLAALRDQNVEAIVVTSGAIALGRARLNIGAPARLDQKQAAAAAGQILLMNAWQAALEPFDIVATQILLTLEDTEDRRRYLNARATIRALLDLGAMPIVNENDTVATAEIRYGDNDRLAAHVAQTASADLLVILSDVDGLYTADPRTKPSAERLHVVDAVTPAIRAAAGGADPAGPGSGGMATKVAAAEIASAAGCAAIVGLGRTDRPLRKIREGAAATLFRPANSRESARRRWIAGRLRPAGALLIDEGAAAALERGASLLPAGVMSVEGEFRRGDLVAIRRAETGAELGRGLCAYDSTEAKRVAGMGSAALASALGYEGRPAMIERDDLALRSSEEP